MKIKMNGVLRLSSMLGKIIFSLLLGSFLSLVVYPQKTLAEMSLVEKGKSSVDNFNIFLKPRENGVEINFDLSQLEKETKARNGEVFDIVSIPDEGIYRYLRHPGKPQLPKLVKIIKVPADAKDLKITVTSAQFKELSNYYIYPAPKEVRVKKEGEAYLEEVFYKDKHAYSIDDFYSQEIIDMRTGMKGGTKLVFLSVFPVQFNPVQRTIRVYEHFSMQLTYTAGKAKVALEEPQQEGLIQEAQVFYPADLKGVSANIAYLIITASGFYNSQPVRDFAEHRAEFSKFNVAVVNIQDIYTQYPDEKKDESIKDFVTWAYTNWNLKFLVLIGDADEGEETDRENWYLPTHILSFLHGPETIAADGWYVCINDDDGDGDIDDYDNVTDLAIGRFSAKTEADLANIISKIVKYDLEAPTTSKDWRSRAALITAYGPRDKYRMYGCFDYIRDRLLLSTKREAREIYGYEIYEEYEREAAMRILQEETTKVIDKGCLILNYRGHGSTTGWSGFPDKYVENLNNISLLPIVFSAACSTGHFTNRYSDCLAEDFTRAEKKGAVAFLGASAGTSAYLNSNFISLLNKAIFEDKSYIVGSIIQQAKLGLITDFEEEPGYAFSYTLFGDPALDITNVISTADNWPELKASFQGHLDSYFTNGARVRIKAEIENVLDLSMSSASNIVVRFLDRYNGNTVQVGEDEVVGYLDIGEKITVEKSWNITGIAPHYLYVVVDPEEQIPELSKYTSRARKCVYVDNFYLRVEKISADSLKKSSPAIYGDKVVWRDEEAKIHVYDIADRKETLFLTDGLPGAPYDDSPCIYGDKVVWADRLYEDKDILMLDLKDKAIVRMTDGVANQSHPAIYANRIVWDDDWNGPEDTNIFFYDLGADGKFDTGDDSGELQITYNEARQEIPSIYGDKIVWQDARNTYPWERDGGFSWNMYVYDLVEQKEMPINPSWIHHRQIDVYENEIVCEFDGPYEDHNSNDIYLYRLLNNGEFERERLSNGLNVSGYRYNPEIYGNRVVWQDERIGKSDIFLYDLATGRENLVSNYLASNGLQPRAMRPAIYENRIVWRDARDKGIYLATISIREDVNQDGYVNILDLIFIRNRINKDVSESDNWKADVNGDGKINILDLIAVRNHFIQQK